MSRARVWNDNKFVHTERFKGETITIQPGSFIEMDFFEAKSFQGQYTPILRDYDGQPLPQSYKIIRVEEIKDTSTKVEAEVHRCQKCADTFDTSEDLEDHIDENHLGDLDPEVAQKRRGRKKKVA